MTTDTNKKPTVLRNSIIFQKIWIIMILMSLQAVTTAVLDPALKHMNLRDYLFTSDEQSIVEDVLVVLKPMKKATLLVSGEKQPSASKILLTLAKLRKEMTVDDKDSEIVKAMKMKVIKNLNKRYKDEKVSSYLLKASFLDQRYKSLSSIAKPGVMLLIKQEIRDMCVLVAETKTQNNTHSLPGFPSTAASVSVKQEPPAVSNNPLDTSDACEPTPAKKIKLETDEYDDWLDDVVYLKTEKEPSVSTIELINQELDRYDAEAQIRGDPLQWWKSREISMPFLAEVARAILCIPGSSVPCERVFSKSGQLLNNRRCSLKNKM